MTDQHTTVLDAPAARTKPERRPGDFDRDANGTPWVSHPDGELTKKGTVKRVRYSRPSGFGEQILDSYNLQKWSERMIVAGFAYGLGTSVPLDRLEALAPADNENQAWRQEADSIARLAKERAKHMLAADRGTHAHQLTEAVDTERDYIAMINDGVDLGISVDAQRGLVAAWQLMLATHGIEILATELAVVHDGYRCAGTLDRIVRLKRDLTFVLPGGELVTLAAGTVLVLDLKTGKMRHDNGDVQFWDNYPIQVAIYAGAVGYNCDTETRYELPWQVDQRWAIIAHLDVLGAIDGEPSCELILVDLEHGRRGADLVAAAKAYERADKFSLVGTCQVASTLPDPHRHSNDFARHEPPAVAAPPDEGPEATEDIVAPFRTRYQACVDGKKWIGELERDALQAHCSFHLSGAKTLRRLRIMEGLVVLAEADAMDDDLVKALVREVTGDNAMTWTAVTAGACVGSLSAVDAAAFVAACELWVAQVRPLVHDEHGPRLGEAA